LVVLRIVFDSDGIMAFPLADFQLSISPTNFKSVDAANKAPMNHREL
jgi:hypothetical protein